MSSPLNQRCSAFLAQVDGVAVDAPQAGFADIYTRDGAHIATVTRGINVADLQAMFRFAHSEYERGRRIGAEGLREQFRTLLNAAPMEPLTR